jgi:hypothetical protein
VTIDQFNADYGQQYRELSEKPIFRALIACIDEASPARRSSVEPLVNVVAAEGTLLGQIRGWEALRTMLKTTLLQQPTPPVRDPDYSEPPV